MTKKGQEKLLLDQVLAAKVMPQLNTDEVSRLQCELTSSGSPMKLNADAVRTAEAILFCNQNIQSIATKTPPTATCTDAQVLLNYANEAATLTAIIDSLNEAGAGPYDRALFSIRELAIRKANLLQKNTGDIRDALNHQDMLTGEHKNTLSKLTRSANRLATTLRASIRNGWGYRVTKESTPPKIVNQWEKDWATIRASSILLLNWAAGMAEAIPTATTKMREKTGTLAIGQKGMKCQEAQRKAEAHVKAHDGVLPSVKRLAEIVGCSRKTIGNSE